MKYCIKCGNKISQGANFCPYCGTKQTTDTRVQIQSPVNNTKVNNTNSMYQQINTRHNFQITPPKGMYTDKKIIEFKHAMGFSSSKYDYCMGYVGHMFSWLSAVSPILGAVEIASKFYVTCFENDGLLMMGISAMGGFTSRIIFIPNKDIQWIGITHGHVVELTTIQEHTLDINFRYLLPLHKVHHLATNRKHLHQLVASLQSRIKK